MKDTYAVKRQLVDSPANPNTRAYRELAIIQQLSKIKPKCYNFVSLIDWFKGK